MVGVRLAGHAFTALGKAIDGLGLRRSSMGRRLLAGLNMLGAFGARLLYMRGGRPVSVDGHKLYLADEHGPSVAFTSTLVRGRYEPETKTLLENLVRDAMTVVDVGAHVGHYALLMARLVGRYGRVYAFEPDPENFSILQRNVALNGYGNITCIQEAVSNHVGTLSLHLSSQGNDRHSIFRNPRSLVREAIREVPTTTLDGFFASEAWPRVDVVKMDIEGAEPLAVEGMTDLLRKSADLRLIIEFAPEILRAGRTDPVEFLTRLLDLGFSVQPVEKDVLAHAFRRENFSEMVDEIEGRGAINLLCTGKAVLQAYLGQ